MTAEPVYLDASAIVKLVRRERESDALASWIQHHPDAVSSVVSSVEVHRALQRAGVGDADRADLVLEHVTLVSIDGPVLARAAHMPGPDLRTLDAIHLATALSLGDHPAAFVTYDRRLAAAADAAGLTVVHPGSEG